MISCGWKARSIIITTASRIYLLREYVFGLQTSRINKPKAKDKDMIVNEISLLEKEKPIMKSHCLSDSLHITLIRSQTVERILKVRNNLIF
jgi:hypothetical protein